MTRSHTDSLSVAAVGSLASSNSANSRTVSDPLFRVGSDRR
jgi:hypothetical protein